MGNYSMITLRIILLSFLLLFSFEIVGEKYNYDLMKHNYLINKTGYTVNWISSDLTYMI